MGRFTRSQREQLAAFLAGAAARKRKKSEKPRPNQISGSALLGEFRLCALAFGLRDSTIPLVNLQKIILVRWENLNEEQRSALAVELARRGFPAKDAGAAALLSYCIAEVEKRGHRVSRISETAMQFVADILNEGGIGGNRVVYELVVKKIDTGSWQETGLLKLLGYGVGRSGLDVQQRRRILRDAYRVSLVPGSEDVVEYLRSWGDPLSQQRINMITGSISRFMGLARNRSADYSAALADWQADLNWIRETS